MGGDCVLHRLRSTVLVSVIRRQYPGTDDLPKLPCNNQSSLFPLRFLRDFGFYRAPFLRYQSLDRNSPAEDPEARWATFPGVRASVGRGLSNPLCDDLVLGQLV